ncbi:tape measure protein [Sphingobium sp. ZW T5_29]|uniref:tape measure protein n=1 Tax=Sphingobium sp. ZW T5_29 TaxID=3378077 RepID=UPI003853E1E1
MAVTADRVVVELEARLDRYEANVARAESKFSKAMGGIQKSAGATEAMVARAAGVMSAALAGVSVVALARSFLTLADEAKKLDAQLRLATAGFGSFGQAQKDVQRIADDTRSGLSETASLYGNFLRNAKEMGATQAQAARATETFSKTLKISGADANQSANAILQFGQALASGAFRGDEFNSVAEASPRTLRLLADSLGVPIGKLREMAAEGELTAQKLLKALTDTKFTAGIDAEFNQMPVTFDDAMTRVYNAAMVTFSAFDRGGEFSSMLADFVAGGADGFSDLEQSAEQFGINVRGTLEGLASAFTPMLEAGQEAFRLLGIDLSNFSMNGRKEIAGILGALDDLLNIGPSVANRFGAGGKFDSRLAQDFQNRSAASDQRLQGQANERRFRSMIGGYDVMGNPLPGTPGSSGGSRPAAASSSGGKKGRATRSPLDPDAFAREEAAINDRILRLKNDESLTAEQRATIELERVEAARNSANQDVSTDKKYTDAQKAKIIALNNQVSALEAASVIYERDAEIAKRTYKLETDANQGAQDLLKSQGDLAETRRQQYEVEKRILKLRQSQERADYELLLKSRDPDDVARGRAGLSRLDAQQPNERAALDRRFESPLEAYSRRLGAVDPQDQVEELVTQELDRVQDGISNAITKRLGIKDPFLSGILDLFIQQNIMKPLAEALAGAGGGGGGVIGAIGGILGFASGGSMTLGGRGGTDTNRLSLNGRPIANVSRGETLSVGSKTLGGRNGGGSVVQPIIQVDARGAVMNDQFAQMILMQANRTAGQMVGAGMSAINKGIPSRMAQFSRDGT